MEKNRKAWYNIKDKIKILLRGNHGFKIGMNTWKEIGFLEVYKKKIILDNLLLTHTPTVEVKKSNQCFWTYTW